MKDYIHKEFPKSCDPDDFFGQVKRTVNGKPVGKDQINMIVDSICESLNFNNEDILFVEALKDYVVIHVGSEKYTIHSTMKEIAKKLPDNTFQRIHRSYIVNLKQIKAIEMPNLILEKSSVILPVGGSYKEELFNKLNLV